MTDVSALESTVFFVTRIGKEGSPARIRSDDLMDLLLEPTVRELNPDLRVVRADQLAPLGQITDKIFHHLLHSAMVVADTTGLNPNVFYEVGVAHAFHRPVVLIIDEADDIPFDVKGLGHLILPGEGHLLGRDLVKARPVLLSALREAQDAAQAGRALGPVAAAESQLTPPDISAEEATALLRDAVVDLSDRVRYLERRDQLLNRLPPFPQGEAPPAPIMNHILTVARRTLISMSLAEAGSLEVRTSSPDGREQVAHVPLQNPIVTLKLLFRHLDVPQEERAGIEFDARALGYLT